MAQKPKKFFSSHILLLLVLGLGLIAFCLYNVWTWYSSTQGAAQPPDSTKTVTISTDTPDEKIVPNDAAYSVPSDQPKKIIIPAINTSGYVQRVGKDQFNNVGVPTNVHFAGWFVESAKPGDMGLSIIDGHVSSRFGSALFAKLGQLVKGDAVHVQFGDNSVRRFQVIERRELSEQKSAQFLFAKKAGVERQLNIITCGGTYSKKSDKYNNRIIVVTKRQ